MCIYPTVFEEMRQFVRGYVLLNCRSFQFSPQLHTQKYAQFSNQFIFNQLRERKSRLQSSASV